ncbi:MAG TPA: malto-oligosyltrehalose trehalohydrolase, partial [Gemmatimonadales bacterium]|nr:malto-oligosyltrehalose trehalohydrolase [Gemmatimonadales bacterium]
LARSFWPTNPTDSRDMFPHDRGAVPLADGRTRFGVWAPAPDRLELCLRRPKGIETIPLERDERGVALVELADAGPGTEYWYRLDGARDRPDPVSRELAGGVHGVSRVVDPAAFPWADGGWQGLAMPDLILYELHVGTFTSAGTFDAAIGRLPYLIDLGVTALEIMPVAEFPGRRNWGYDGVSLYAPHSGYGGPEGLRRLVDAAHRAGLAVLLDVVYNHLGPEGNYLREFGPYFNDRYRTAWGEGYNLDGPDSDEVRRYLTGNAVYWIDEFHLDGLRLDAADRIVDLSPVHLAEEIGAAVHRLGADAGRRTVVIAEIDSNDPRWVRPRNVGGFGLDGHWSDDFHHAVHVALTGERGGYYADFGGVGPVARALGRRYVHDGGYSAFRRRRHGHPADDVPGDRFVVCVQNHDQVGNRATGERLAALVEPAGVRLAAAILLLAPYVPLLFMGEEYAECSPFLYFVSHGDPALIEAVREGRRREFAAFGWRGEVPDPQSEATFAASSPRWERAGQGEHAQVLALYRDLLRLRRALPLLRPGAAEPAVRHDEKEGWVAMRLSGGDQTLDAVFNFSTGLRDVPGTAHPADLLLDTDDPRYGGAGQVRRTDRGLALPPRTAALLRSRR